MRRVQIASILILFLSCAAWAQQAPSSSDVAALLQKVRDLEDRVVSLEGQLRQFKAQPQPAAPPTTATAPSTPSTAPATQPQVSTEQGAAGSTTSAGGTENVRLGGAGGAAAKALNPDISVIGDFIVGAGHNPFEPTPSLEMHESEVGLQAIVDPYARADFFISFGEEGVNLEEGFLTFTELPGGLLTKVGKMRAAFGKVNTLHNHVLPWTDRPMVINNLVGGEDGIDDAGISVARLIPIPGVFLEATGQVFRGDSGESLY